MHGGAGFSVFVTRPFGQDTIVGFYYRSMVYEDLGRRQYTKNMHGAPIVAVTRHTLRTVANQFPETAIDQIQVGHPV